MAGEVWREDDDTSFSIMGAREESSILVDVGLYCGTETERRAGVK
jgi:hypothetical protein